MILDAACDCLGARAVRGDINLDVNDVLVRANELWGRRFGGTAAASRELTRGAITSQWGTVRKLEQHAVLAWFEHDLVRIPAIGRLASDVLAASRADSNKERRRLLGVTLSMFVRDTILGDRDRVQWAMRFLALRYCSSAPLQMRLQQAYADRRKQLLPVYAFAVRAAGWAIKPKKLLDMHLAIIDGSLTQLTANRTKHDDVVATTAATAADLLCRGLDRRPPKLDSTAAKHLDALVQREGPWVTFATADRALPKRRSSTDRATAG
ncbi:hypothetical protein [Microbacterium maritypicum]